MKLTILILISLLVLCIFAIPLFTSKKGNKLNEVSSFDYYRFSFEFPGAICMTKDCSDEYLGNLPDYGINMHGFWPQKAGGIDFCLYDGYDESKLQSEILAEINANWVGTYNPTDKFRDHEWSKHGTCWAQQYYQPNSTFLGGTNYYDLMNQYFTLVMKLKQDANLGSVFFGDETNDRVELTLDQIQSMMSDNYGVEDMDLVCETIDDEQYLTEARFCLDLSYNYMDCADPIVTCKPGTVIVQAFIRS